ncbi:MAG TPA: hypothetical protein VNZ53_09310, partial [Steroidobacteraceae bacterium]|nr:hypothetical protein [Steroidobacteraceae bacterium]
PGGWNLIGRTPLELVNVADNYFPLRAGDRVQFVRIGVSEFEKLSGRRLGDAVTMTGTPIVRPGHTAGPGGTR